MKRIASRANAFFKLLQEIAESPRARREQGLTLLDGLHLVETYAARGGGPRHLVLSESGAGRAEVLAASAQFRDVDTVSLTDDLFARISQVSPQVGILAVIPIPPEPPPVKKGFAVLLEDIQDPGNVGSILRTAAAAGVSRAYLSPQCADPWSPKVLRAGMGAHFFLLIEPQADLVAVARSWTGTMMAAAAQAPNSVFDAVWESPVAFVIGNEGSGISAPLLAAVGRKVRIPMPGGMESLNAAAAAAVCLYEAVRRQTGGGRGRQPPGAAPGAGQ